MQRLRLLGTSIGDFAVLLHPHPRTRGGGRMTISVIDQSHEYTVDVAKHDYDPSRIEFTFIDLTEETVTPF